MTGMPNEPLVAISSAARQGLPEDARRLLERGRVPFADACEFLGIGRGMGYPMARRYIKRTRRLVESGKPFNVKELAPERDKQGRWREIPCYQVGGKFICRADLLVGMAYPEALR